MAGQTTYVIEDKNNVTKVAERLNTTNISK